MKWEGGIHGELETGAVLDGAVAPHARRGVGGEHIAESVAATRAEALDLSREIGDRGAATEFLFGANEDIIGTSDEPINPLLGPLQDNGGPTMTHALGAGSVAIDHIPAVDCGVTTDQRGEPRPETGGDACDVGSFERQPEDP